MCVLKHFNKGERRSHAFRQLFNNGNGVPTRSPRNDPWVQSSCIPPHTVCTATLLASGHLCGTRPACLLTIHSAPPLTLALLLPTAVCTASVDGVIGSHHGLLQSKLSDVNATPIICHIYLDLHQSTIHTYSTSRPLHNWRN